MIRIALIGNGYWGRNYVRMFGELSQAKVILVWDAQEARLWAVQQRYPAIETRLNWEDALSCKDVDAIVIATPASSHFDIAQQALLAGKHVLVEKPLTTSVAACRGLVEMSQRCERVLMVGHTFLYNAGVRKLKEYLCSNEFGKTYYLHATRTNMGPVRTDVNTLWDLATHDVSIFNYLLDSQPEWVSAIGTRVLGREKEDVGFATLAYPDGILGNIHISWVDPNKVRTVTAVGSQRRVVFDDLNNDESVRVFEKGIAPAEPQADSFGEFRLLVRDGDIISPRVEPSEPLKNMGEHFIECIMYQKQPLTDGQNGLDVVRVMVALDQSLARHGTPVEVI